MYYASSTNSSKHAALLHAWYRSRSACMFFPYSKNVGAEFVSKINLAIVHPSGHCPCRPTLFFYDVHTTWYSFAVQCVHTYITVCKANYNGKVPNIAMHTLCYVVGCVHLIILSIIPPSVHQMHTNVLLCHLVLVLEYLRSITCKT
jgi:hypothetical protein